MAALVSIAQPSLLEPDKTSPSYSDRAPEAVLQDADRITVHSGNIASWHKLRRRAVLTTTDEVRTACTYYACIRDNYYSHKVLYTQQVLRYTL